VISKGKGSELVGMSMMVEEEEDEEVAAKETQKKEGR